MAAGRDDQVNPNTVPYKILSCGVRTLSVLCAEPTIGVLWTVGAHEDLRRTGRLEAVRAKSSGQACGAVRCMRGAAVGVCLAAQAETGNRLTTHLGSVFGLYILRKVTGMHLYGAQTRHEWRAAPTRRVRRAAVWQSELLPRMHKR